MKAETNMVASEVVECMQRNFVRVERWPEHLSPAERRHLAEPEVLRELSRRSYIDAYWRVCETTPLILSAIAALNRDQDHAAADFWAEHLREELGHDRLQRGDLGRMYGSDLDAVLTRHPMTPPSIAVIAYFRAHVERGAPHMLMVYRMYLELFTANMPGGGRVLRERLGEDATRSVGLHCELDGDHVQHCQAYLDRHFTSVDRERLLWSVEFITEQLVASQLYIFAPLLQAR